MAWDFSTDPEFERQLEWMRDFVQERIYPLETLDLDWRSYREVIKPLMDEVKAQGLWAAHLGPEHGGQGYGQVKLGLMHEILGRRPVPDEPLHKAAQAPLLGSVKIGDVEYTGCHHALVRSEDSYGPTRGLRPEWVLLANTMI